MSRHTAGALALLAPLALILIGCSGLPVAPAATPSPIGSGGPTSSSTPAVTSGPQASGPSADIEIDITGGPHEGSYRAVAHGACQSAPEQNRFTVNYVNNAAPGGFVALDLVLNDADTAQNDESNDFVANISVGGPNGGVTYSLNPKNGEGTGFVFLDISPYDATVDLEVDARDGSTIDVTVICDLV